MGIAKRKGAALRNLALAASAKRQKTAERVANTTAADNTVANQNPGERSILVEADVQYTLKANMLAAVDSVPLDSIRRFFNRSHRFVHAYRLGLSGQAAVWANRKYWGHRMLPPGVVQEVEAEFRRQQARNHIIPAEN